MPCPLCVSVRSVLNGVADSTVFYRIGAGELPPLPEPEHLSEAGIDFILCCLTINPADRPTADELLTHHPWVRPCLFLSLPACVAVLTSLWCLAR